MKKVYCKNCKYLYESRRWDIYCLHPNNVKECDSWYKKDSRLLREPYTKNKNNDCKDFEPKLFYKLKIWLYNFCKSIDSLFMDKKLLKNSLKNSKVFYD